MTISCGEEAGKDKQVREREYRGGGESYGEGAEEVKRETDMAEVVTRRVREQREVAKLEEATEEQVQKGRMRRGGS